MSKISDLIAKYCPNGVKLVSLGDLGVFENIGVDKKIIEGEELVKLLNYVDVYKNAHITSSVPTMIVSASPKKIAQCNIVKGDLFITPTSETRDDIGHAAVAIEDIEGACYSYHIMRYRMFEPNIITAFFIRYLFGSAMVQKQICMMAQGLTRFGLSKYKFAAIKIPLPPLPVQQVIVRILDSFTALEAELEAELEARKKQYEHYRDKLLNFADILQGG